MLKYIMLKIVAATQNEKCRKIKKKSFFKKIYMQVGNRRMQGPKLGKLCDLAALLGKGLGLDGKLVL